MNTIKNDKAKLKYEYYNTGKSLAEVGLAFNCSRQSVWELFKNRDWKMRAVERKEYIKFNNFKYTKRKDGYYRKTSGDRSLLHADVWVYYNKEKPEGYDIHHKNKNLNDNDINNLQLILKSEHGKIHSIEGHKVLKDRRCCKSA